MPVLVTGGFFRLAADRYYVPIAVAVPGSVITVPAGKDKAPLDVLGMVRDEQGRPVGRIRQTMDLAGAAASTLAGKQVLYQSGVTLPPGRFALKVVVRENTNGAIGSFETAVVVPELKQATRLIDEVVLPMTRAYGELLASAYESVAHAETVNDHLKWLNRLEFTDWVPPALAFR